MIKVNGTPIKIGHFPDGTQKLNVWRVGKERDFLVEWIYEKEEELSALIYIARHLKDNPYTKSVVLQMNYFPNARMDRIHEEDEVFTLKGFADVINWLGFDSVKTLDVHSNVGFALIKNICLSSPKKYIDIVIGNIRTPNSELVLYFPDEGSAKRYSNMFPQYKYCYGEKNRDWETGKILGLNIRSNGIDLTDKTVLMIDDIISYGGSLHYSAVELKGFNVLKIYAFVTHTENNILDKKKGTLIKDLENNIVERLFTTNSLFTRTHKKITVMEVNHEESGCITVSRWV